ncbi:hypothetical protein ABFU50_13910 [Xanthomonas campestris pv. campestris]|uniref:hypothetical protein n=1 Tax=Xanthomonas campestris TaxID=339 RepID=UPI00388EDA4F
MKLRFWKGESPETIPMDAPEFSAESSGWKGTAQEKSTHPGAIYLLQLADERFALKDGAGYLILRFPHISSWQINHLRRNCLEESARMAQSSR